MDKHEKIVTYAAAFCMMSAGALLLAFVPSALGIRQVQLAPAFTLLAGGHRLFGLAFTYDASAAAIAMVTVVSEVLFYLFLNRLSPNKGSFFLS